MSNWVKSIPKGSGFEEIQRAFGAMLDDGQHIYDAAANALLGGTDPEAIRHDLFETDSRINRTEQKIRRRIVVHGAVRGAQSFPALLVMMSLAKDAERIGDYAKNIFDLAVQKPSLGDEAQRAKLVELKDEISRLLIRAGHIFFSQDEDSAREFLREADRIEDACDGLLVKTLSEGETLAGVALTARYFKRVTSHASNIVTSIVMPLDKLDFFDE